MTRQIVLDGKAVAQHRRALLKERVDALIAANRRPMLGIIYAGEDPGSQMYIKMKQKACNDLGIQCYVYGFPEETCNGMLLNITAQLNATKACHGIMVQHPLPYHLSTREIFDSISPEKDVDGLTTASFGKISFGEKAFAAATPKGIMTLLDHYGYMLEGVDVTIIGRSPILGKPLAALMLNQNASVTVMHSKSCCHSLKMQCQEADVIVAACGVKHLVEYDWVRPNQVLIDAGYHPGNFGDIHPDCFTQAKFYTPVPGGVGPMTIISLLENVVEAAENQRG